MQALDDSTAAFVRELDEGDAIVVDHHAESGGDAAVAEARQRHHDDVQRRAQRRREVRAPTAPSLRCNRVCVALPHAPPRPRTPAAGCGATWLK